MNYFTATKFCFECRLIKPTDGFGYIGRTKNRKACADCIKRHDAIVERQAADRKVGL